MKKKKEKVVILGSTGSIGTQSIDVIKTVGDKDIIGLACNGDIEKIYEQAKETGARYICIYDERKAKEFVERYCRPQGDQYEGLICTGRPEGVKMKAQSTEGRLALKYCRPQGDQYGVSGDQYVVFSGMKGLLKLAGLKEADMIIISVVGMIGIRPTIEAIKKKKIVCLANKESLVCAGDIIIPLAKKNKVEIRPIDSEHSAIWQSLSGEKYESIKRLLITASGGPFYGRKISELKKIKPADALKHPNWSMGRKITIDSSTLVNKGLEVMEAHHLFQVPYDKIDVVVQRESLIHSMVEFVDGAVKAELGVPSMRVPIEYAIYKENRKFINENVIDWDKIDRISIGTPDVKTFKGLKLAYEAAKIGGLMPSVYNALNEVAVAKFLNDEIGYLDIIKIIEGGMKDFAKKKLNKEKFTVEDIEATMIYAERFVK